MQQPQQSAIIIDDNNFVEVLRNELGASVANFLLIPQDGSDVSRLPFNWQSAKSYYSQYCSEGNDCPDGEYPLDCTHFVGHGLSKTKIIVNLPETACANGICIRVAELAAAFKNSTTKYSNVKKINDLAQTKEGDFCFVVSWFGLSKDHALVLADRIGANGGKVYGHTNHRCAQTVDLTGQSLVVYRIE